MTPEIHPGVSTNGKTWRWVAVALIAIAVLAGYLVWNRPKQPEPVQVVQVPLPPSKAEILSPAASTAPTVSPPTPPAAITKSMPKVSYRSVLMKEMRESKDLKAFFDKYTTPAYEKNHTAIYAAAAALSTCGMFISKKPEEITHPLFDLLAPGDSLRGERQKAFDVTAKRCEGFYKFSGESVLNLQKRAADLGEPAALAVRAYDMAAAGKREEAAKLVQALLTYPDGEIIDRLAPYFMFRKDPWTVGPQHEMFDRALMEAAWTTLSCTAGSDCGPTSRFVLEKCWSERICDIGSVDEYYQRKYPPATYELIMRIRTMFQSAIVAQDWASLGLVLPPK